MAREGTRDPRPRPDVERVRRSAPRPAAEPTRAMTTLVRELGFSAKNQTIAVARRVHAFARAFASRVVIRRRTPTALTFRFSGRLPCCDDQWHSCSSPDRCSRLLDLVPRHTSIATSYIDEATSRERGVAR